VSEVFTVITETREAAAVKLISVVVKRFTDVCLFIRVQLVEFPRSVNVWLLIKRAVKGGFPVWSLMPV